MHVAMPHIIGENNHSLIWLDPIIKKEDINNKVGEYSIPAKRLFNQISRRLEEGNQVLNTSTDRFDETDTDKNIHGIYSHHAYSILGTKHIEKEPGKFLDLVILQNP
jgi:hypothetical protein